MSTRADRNNNPTAMTTGVAKDGGLVFGSEYKTGDPFEAGGQTYYTAYLLGDPLALTLRVINQAGFRTKSNMQRWSYISLPDFVWHGLSQDVQIQVITLDVRARGRNGTRASLRCADVINKDHSPRHLVTLIVGPHGWDLVYPNGAT
jgi:hypothetical protein